MNKCKGSKLWMWKIVTDDKLRSGVEGILKKKHLEWISPKIDEKNKMYKEFRLNEGTFLNEMSKMKNFSSIKKEVFDFWPSQGPVWDGIAVSEESKTIYLFEAKSYPREMNSKTRAKEESLKIIRCRMKEACKALFGRDSKYKEELWEKNKVKGERSYYQLGNRLTFLYNLSKEKENTNVNVKIVFLNIIKDYTHSDENKMFSKEDWEKHYSKVLKEMCYGEIADKKLVIPQNVEIIYYDDKKKEFTRSDLYKNGE